MTDLVKVTTNEPNPFYLRFGVADELRRDGLPAPAAPAAGRSTGPCPTRADRAGTGASQQPAYQADRRGHRDLEHAAAAGLRRAGQHRRAGRQLALRRRPCRSSSPTGRTRKGKKYSFDYVRATYTPEALRRAEPLPTGRTRSAGSSPQCPAGARGRRAGRPADRRASAPTTTRSGRSTTTSPADNGFSYSLSTESGTSGQDIVDFLTNKVGFCQQYAAAMAWLVRAAGIPARVAFGFTNGSQRDGDTYTLTNLNLHAWTEVYFDGFGWVPFDATPAYGVPGSTRVGLGAGHRRAGPEPTRAGATERPGGTDPSAGPTGPTTGRRGTPTTGRAARRGAAGERATDLALVDGGRVAVLLVLLAVPALRRVAAAPAPAARAAGARGDGRRRAGRPRHAPGHGTVLVTGADAGRARARRARRLGRAARHAGRLPGPGGSRPRRRGRPRSGWSGTAGLDDGRRPREAARLLGRAEERARYARDPLTGEQLIRRCARSAGRSPPGATGVPGSRRRCCRRRCCCAGGRRSVGRSTAAGGPRSGGARPAAALEPAPAAGRPPRASAAGPQTDGPGRTDACRRSARRQAGHGLASHEPAESGHRGWRSAAAVAAAAGWPVDERVGYQAAGG